MKSISTGLFTIVSVVLLCATALYLNSVGGLAVSNENLWTTGKIFVVISVLTIIFVGIIFFLLHLERKITDLENRFKEND